MMQPNTARTAAEATQLVLDILDRLRSRSDLTEKDLWQLHSDHARSQEFITERDMLNRLVDLLLNANPSMISHRTIYTTILYGIIGLALQMPLSQDEIVQMSRDTITNILAYQATREVDVPIVNLAVGLQPFEFGSVTFHPITDHDRTTKWWTDTKAYWGQGSPDFHIVSYARVTAPGDLDTSIRYAGSTISEMLLLIRGIAFPFNEEYIPQFGVINDFPAIQNRPYRLGEPKENVRLEGSSNLVTTLGPPTRPYDLREDLLSSLDPTTLSSFIELVRSTGLNPEHKMRAKLLTGFRWIGEATKPDVISARFAKLSFALEALIGGEPKGEKWLTSRGLTAMLAERAAFLVGSSAENRLSIDRDVRDFYGLRSGIVHGKSDKITGKDLLGFAHLVRTVAWSLLTKIDEFSSIDVLQCWVQRQRYS